MGHILQEFTNFEKIEHFPKDFKVNSIKSAWAIWKETLKFALDLTESEFCVVRLSYKQYLNLKNLPITVYYEITKGAKITLSEEDKKSLVEKIEQAGKESKSY